MMKVSFITMLVLMLCASHVFAFASSPEGHHYLIEAKVVIEGKTYNPVNISATIGSNIAISEYSFNLSSANYNKNVTVPLRLFIWYNGQWSLSRQTILLKITDKRNVLTLQSHLLAQLLKYNSRRYQSRMIDEKQSVILNHTSVIISYDPQSSLFVSRLEDPVIFTPHNNYVPLSTFTTQMKSRPMKITLNFNMLTRSDQFIDLKNHIVSLNQLSSKIKERIPLLSRLPQPQTIEPKQLWRIVLQNYETMRKNNKQYSEKIALMGNKKYQSLLAPRLHQVPSQVSKLIKQQLLALNVSVSDAFIPTYYFALHQGFILDNINQIQGYLRENVNVKLSRDYLVLFQELASKDIIISFVAAILWIILDIVSYKRNSCSQGVSYSFGYFLVAWLIVEILTLSIRIGQSSNAYYGLGFVSFSLITIKFVVSYFQRTLHQFEHKHSFFDRKMTEYVFNLIFLGVLANGLLHLFVQQDIKGGAVLLWSLGQFEMLLRQYYYFLVMIPPLFLSLKLRSSQPISWLRLLVFLMVGLKDDYWLFIDQSHWAIIALRLKQEILFVLLLLAKIILANKPIEIAKESQPAKAQQTKTENTSEIKLSKPQQQKQQNIKEQERHQEERQQEERQKQQKSQQQTRWSNEKAAQLPKAEKHEQRKQKEEPKVQTHKDEQKGKKKRKQK